jgi:dTDP-glucose 4,6-dehydratase
MAARHVITGGSGFLGLRLRARLAARGEPVVNFDLVGQSALASEVYVSGDVRRPDDLAAVGFRPDDIVYHLAARQFHGDVPPRRTRLEGFMDVNLGGTRQLLEAMRRGGARRLVFFSTDMTYGIPDQTPVAETHRQSPLGPYGASKLAAERAIIQARQDWGLAATLLRPRLIAGKGRLGVLAKLFRLIELNAPVPMIGGGHNRYQMVAVEDCVTAALRASEAGFPSGPFNLGSADAPQVRDLLKRLIRRAGSRSWLLPTPAWAVKLALTSLDVLGRPLLYPEQFLIADKDYVLSTRRAEAELGWSPTATDGDILFAAYDDYLRQGSTDSR